MEELNQAGKKQDQFCWVQRWNSRRSGPEFFCVIPVDLTGNISSRHGRLLVHLPPASSSCSECRVFLQLRGSLKVKITRFMKTLDCLRMSFVLQLIFHADISTQTSPERKTSD